MGEAIGEILPLAVGVAISPIPIIAVILMLFSEGARSNGPAFLAGWIVGLAIVGVVVLLVAGGAGIATGDEKSNAAGTVQLVLGALLLLAGLRRWRRRPAPGDEVTMPRWMSAIDAFTLPKAFAAGFALSAINPKNLLLTIAAGTAIARAGLSAGEEAVVLVIFVALASVTIAGAVLLYLVGGARAKEKLDGWKAWLGTHSAAVMAVLLVVFGAVLLGKGISGLSA
jgi:threonine/homoserine/homoserine lactone efflux protein